MRNENSVGVVSPALFHSFGKMMKLLAASIGCLTLSNWNANNFLETDFSRSIHLWRNKHLTRVSHVCSLLRIQASCVGRRGSTVICDVCRCGGLYCLLRIQSSVGRDPLDYLLSYVNTKDFWTANNPQPHARNGNNRLFEENKCFIISPYTCNYFNKNMLSNVSSGFFYCCKKSFAPQYQKLSFSISRSIRGCHIMSKTDRSESGQDLRKVHPK